MPDDFDAMVSQASNDGQEARAARRRNTGERRKTAKDIVGEIIAAEPDIERAALIRRVLAATGFDSAGCDAMSDDDLMQIISRGNRVLAVLRAIKKENDNA